MGSCQVFSWARAVLNPHYLSLLPESLDRISLLKEVAASLKLTADLSSDKDSPALQGEWDDIIQAQMKLLGLISESRISADENEEEADHYEIPIGVEEQPEKDTMKLLGLISESRISADENEEEADHYEIPIGVEEQPEKDTVGSSEIGALEVGATVVFEERENGDIINKTSNVEEAETIFVENWENSDSANCPITTKTGEIEVCKRNVFVIADDLDQLNLLSQNCETTQARIGDEDESITAYVDGTQQQLIFVTGSILESDDKVSEDACLKVEDEIYMNIVLDPGEDNSKASGDDSSTETSNSKDKDNPLNKLCQLLRIDDEDDVVDRRSDELEKRRKYESNLPYKYFCTQCSFKSKRENHYQKHLKLHEKHVSLYSCSKCPYRTIRLGMLKRHEIQHNQDKLVNCKLCSYKTDNSKLLIKHIESKHTGHRLRCAECGFKTGSRRDLNNHKRIHAPVKQKEYWDCDQCAYRTQNRSHLTRHRNDMHGEARPFLCHHCGKSFKRLDTLKQHKVVHGDGDSSQTHVCSYCSKVCRTSAHMKEHMTAHSTQRPILCELCGATFKTRSVHYRHVKKMHSDVSFQCTICKQSFCNKSALVKHAKTHRSGGNSLVIKTDS